MRTKQSKTKTKKKANTKKNYTYKALYNSILICIFI